MDTIFMSFKNTKASKLYRILLNLSDKINLMRSNNLLYQILACPQQSEMDKPGAAKPREGNKKKFKKMFLQQSRFYTIKTFYSMDKARAANKKSLKKTFSSNQFSYCTKNSKNKQKKTLKK